MCAADRFIARLPLFPYGLLNNPAPVDDSDCRFVVYELSSVCNDELILSVVTSTIMHDFERMMRRKKGFKMLVIDEAWKAISNETMSPKLMELWRTARKHSAAAVVVTQDVADIRDNDVEVSAAASGSGEGHGHPASSAAGAGCRAGAAVPGEGGSAAASPPAPEGGGGAAGRVSAAVQPPSHPGSGENGGERDLFSLLIHKTNV